MGDNRAMADQPSEHRTITKDRLAKLLGIPATDLLTRKEAADKIGISVKSLANLGQKSATGACPMFYCSTTTGTAGTTWYPRAEVDAFVAHRNSPIKRSYERKNGRQDWTLLEKSGERVELHRITNLVWIWKKSELYYRAEAILNAPDCRDGENAFYNECAAFLSSVRNEKATAPLSAALANHKKFSPVPDRTSEDFVSDKFLKLVGWRGLHVDLAHPSFKVMLGMMESAWGFVLTNEAEWRARGYASMPTIPPPTSSRIPI